MRGWRRRSSAVFVGSIRSKESRVRRRLSLAATRKLDGFRGLYGANQIDRAVRIPAVVSQVSTVPWGGSRKTGRKDHAVLPE